MKRFTVFAVALTLFAAGCDETLNPVTPTAGQVTLASQLSAAAEVPPAGSQGNPAGALEAGAAGTLSVTMVPAAGAYTASFTFSVGNLIKSGLLPAPLDSGSVIVAGHIHSGAAGAAGPPIVPLPISLAAPIVTPTGSVTLTISNVAVTADAASAILANPAGFYFNLHSALNPAGVVRGQLAKQ
jgi:CHRD domain